MPPKKKTSSTRGRGKGKKTLPDEVQPPADIATPAADEPDVPLTIIINFAVCQRMPPYFKRIQPMPNVPLAYFSVYQGMSDMFRTVGQGHNIHLLELRNTYWSTCVLHTVLCICI